MPTSGLIVDTVATDGASRPVPSDTCWRMNPRIPATASTYGCQLESIVETLSPRKFERRFGERRRQSEQHAGDRAVDRGAGAGVGAVAATEAAAAPPDTIAIRTMTTAHSALGAFSFPPAGSANTVNSARPPMITAAPMISLGPDVLIGQPVAEREREHDGGDEERLDDRQASLVERDRLDDVAAQQGDGAERATSSDR